MSEKILEFEGQTKSKLGTQAAQVVVSNLIYSKMTYYLNENKEFAIRLIKKCQDSATARLAARKAKEEARTKRKAKESVILSDKLTPAQSKEYDKNELFIVEGDSAGGTAKKGRDPKHQAILPLRGKPLNTDGLTIDKILNNLEFSTIINTIGAGVGDKFDIEDIHYNKIIIMTDADTDGAHIQTLLLTFFYNYMRPLITEGHVYVAVPPLYRVYKEDKFGNVIFGENTHSSGFGEREINKGEKIVADIEFVWPQIQASSYFLTLGLGEGDNEMQHTIQCWAHNIFEFRNISNLPDHGLFNQKIENFSIKRKDDL